MAVICADGGTLWLRLAYALKLVLCDEATGTYASNWQPVRTGWNKASSAGSPAGKENIYLCFEKGGLSRFQ